MSSETARATGGKPQERPSKPGLTLLEALVALLILGTMAAVVAPRIIRRQREMARQRARFEVWNGSQARAKGRWE